MAVGQKLRDTSLRHRETAMYRQHRLVSEYSTVAKAFASTDAMSAQTVRTGAPSDGIALAVVDAHGDVVPRPATH